MNGRAQVLTILGLYFLANSLVQTLAPLEGVGAGLDGLELGVMVMLVGGGVGLFTDVAFGLAGDQWGLARMAGTGVAVAAAACAIMTLERSESLLFTGAIAYGVGNSAAVSSLVALLSKTANDLESRRTQGLNTTVQRVGALCAAVIVGIALEGLGRSAIGVGAFLALSASLWWVVKSGRQPRGRKGRGGSADHWRATPRLKAVLSGYARGLRLLGEGRIAAAAAVNVVLGIIFIETNSFIPLDEGPAHRANGVWVATALASRDICAILAALLVAYGPRWLVSRRAIVTSLGSAVIGSIGLAMWSSSGVSWTAGVCCGLLGVAVGVSAAAANLLALSGTAPHQRATGMAASGLASRVSAIVMPLLLGWCFGVGGVSLVFAAAAVSVAGLALFVRWLMIHGSLAHASL